MKITLYTLGNVSRFDSEDSRNTSSWGLEDVCGEGQFYCADFTYTENEIFKETCRALGVSPDDDEYDLYLCPNGKYAVLGLREDGYQVGIAELGEHE